MNNRNTYIRKIERSKVDFLLWRKKVDKSIFKEQSTPIPAWVSDMWNLDRYFINVDSIKKEESKTKIYFEKKPYNGNISLHKVPAGVKPIYRLHFEETLVNELKDVFLMSHMRGIEQELNKEVKVENEIPFWEFLDIEFNESEKSFLLTAYYRQKPTFPELFSNLVNSPALSKVEDKAFNKNSKPRIYKQDWLPKTELDSHIGATNVIYMLADTNNEILYIGETLDLKKRLTSDYPSIPNWDFFRYDVLPDELKDYRVTIERMLIHQFASIMKNKKQISNLDIDKYELANEKIDKK